MMKKREKQAYDAIQFMLLPGDDVTPRRLEGIAVVYNEVNEYYRTIFSPGCFVNSVARVKSRRVPLLFAHNDNDPIGVVEEIRDDNVDGKQCLKFVASLSDTKRAEECVRLIKSGAATGVSVQIIPLQASENGGVTVLKEVKLLEISIVTIPAFDDARVTAVRSVPDSVLDDIPLAPRDYEWNADSAVTRVREWAGRDNGDIDFDRYVRAFMYYDGEAPDKLSSYKLPFCDIINDKLHAVPRAIFAIAGGHGVDAADIPDEDKIAIREAVNVWYRRMRNAFEDDNLVSPFETESDHAGEEASKYEVPQNTDVLDYASAYKSALETLYEQSGRLRRAIEELEDVITRARRGYDDTRGDDPTKLHAPPGVARDAGASGVTSVNRNELRKIILDLINTFGGDYA